MALELPTELNGEIGDYWRIRSYSWNRPQNGKATMKVVMELWKNTEDRAKADQWPMTTKSFVLDVDEMDDFKLNMRSPHSEIYKWMKRNVPAFSGALNC
jgi:hypothetical protein